MDTNGAREIGIVQIYATDVKRLKFIMGKGNNDTHESLELTRVMKNDAQKVAGTCMYTTLLPRVTYETPRCCSTGPPCSRSPSNYFIVDDRVGRASSPPPRNADILSGFIAQVSLIDAPCTTIYDHDVRLTAGFSAWNALDHYCLYLHARWTKDYILDLQ